MKKKEARKIAVNFFVGAWDNYYEILSKTAIDDKGTLSNDGYSDDDLDKIKTELDFLIRKILKAELK